MLVPNESENLALRLSTLLARCAVFAGREMWPKRRELSAVSVRDGGEEKRLGVVWWAEDFRLFHATATRGWRPI